MTDQLLTPVEAFSRWIKGEPTECDVESTGPKQEWAALANGPNPSYSRAFWTEHKFRIPPSPLTFVEACEQASRKTRTGGIIRCDGMAFYVDEKQRIAPSHNQRPLTVADLRRNDWRVE